MNRSRIAPLAIIALAIMLILGQGLSGGAKAAPAGSIHASASFINQQPTGHSAKPQPQNPTTGQTPALLTVQGRLTNASGQPIIVATNVTFKLYSSASGGSAFYSEGPVSVTPDSNGLFTYALNGGNNFDIYAIQDFENQVYLGLTVGSDAEMTPRFLLTAAPYAMSLIPGAAINGPVEQHTQPYYGALNVINTNLSDPYNAGIYGFGSIGVYGSAGSDDTHDSYGGFFYNSADAGHNNYGIYSAALNGWGLYSASSNTSGPQQSVGVVGQSFDVHGLGGVFTGTVGGVVAAAGSNPPLASADPDGVTGLSSATDGDGVFGHATGVNGYGVWASAVGGDASALGGYFQSYDAGSTSVGLDVEGKGLASGGFSTGLDYGMMVRYNGSEPLHSGDVLALDGSAATFNGASVLGTVKANANNASAAVGVAQYRYNVYTPKGKPITVQTDKQATSFQQGDLIEVVVLGQAQMKVSGAASVGDRLGLASDGSIAATKDSPNSIGKIAIAPDANGNAIVFVNFK